MLVSQQNGNNFQFINSMLSFKLFSTLDTQYSNQNKSMHSLWKTELYDQHNQIVGIPHRHTHQHRNQQSHFKNFKMLTKFLQKYIVTTRSRWSCLSSCHHRALYTAPPHTHNAIPPPLPSKTNVPKKHRLCVGICFVGLPYTKASPNRPS